MPAIDRVGLRVNFIDETWINYADCVVIGGAFSIVGHKNFSGNFNEKK